MSPEMQRPPIRSAAAVPEVAHERAVGGAQLEGDQYERDAKAQHDLRKHQGERCVHPECQDRERRDQRHEPTGSERDVDMQQSFHHLRTGVRANGSGGESRGQQPHSKHHAHGRPERRGDGGVRPSMVSGGVAAPPVCSAEAASRSSPTFTIPASESATAMSSRVARSSRRIAGALWPAPWRWVTSEECR